MYESALIGSIAKNGKRVTFGINHHHHLHSQAIVVGTEQVLQHLATLFNRGDDPNKLSSKACSTAVASHRSDEADQASPSNATEEGSGTSEMSNPVRRATGSNEGPNPGKISTELGKSKFIRPRVKPTSDPGVG